MLGRELTVIEKIGALVVASAGAITAEHEPEVGPEPCGEDRQHSRNTER